MRLAILLLLAVSGCAVFEERPDRSCSSNSQCFRAQGEVCNLQTKQCEVAPDAGALETDEALVAPAEELAHE